MSLAQVMAMKFELAHAANNCKDQALRIRMLRKLAAMEECLKAGMFNPPEKRRRRSQE